MFFSSSGFRRLASLRIVPLPFGSGEKAYILAADASASGPCVPEDWRKLETAACEGLSAFASRFMGPNAAERGASLASKAADAFDAALETARGRGLKTIFAVVPLDPLIQRMQTRTPEADSSRLYSEVCASIAKMFSLNGSVVPLPRDRVGILLASQSVPDSGLVLHQVSSGLGRQFLGLGNLPLAAERVLDPSLGDFDLGDLYQSEREGS